MSVFPGMSSLVQFPSGFSSRPERTDKKKNFCISFLVLGHKVYSIALTAVRMIF